MPAFSFSIEQGKIQGRQWLWDSLKRLFLTLPDGQYIWPHPEKPKRSRSGQQNRYYHGVVCKLIAEHTGYTGDEIHQILARMFLSYKRGGKVFTRSTTKLKTAEFETYMERCRRWAAMELQVYIPLPNESSSFYYDLPSRKGA